MRRLGEVVRVAGGLAIARCPDGDRPDIGEAALDESLDVVGRVVDVFGPTARPYLAISPAGGRAPTDLLGRRLYAR